MTDEWEVFLTPHTDDEVIGMAGAITRAHVAKRKTLVVLATDNRPSARQRRQFPDRTDLAECRLVEWRKAMAVLHVDELQEWDAPETEMIDDPIRIQRELEHRLGTLILTRSVIRLHTVIGTDDVHQEVGCGSLSHALCANAVSRTVAHHSHVFAILHGVYVYSKDVDQRMVIGALPVTRHDLTSYEWRMKRKAIACYRFSKDTIGYGYTSVPELFDGADTDSHEYTVELR